MALQRMVLQKLVDLSAGILEITYSDAENLESEVVHFAANSATNEAVSIAGLVVTSPENYLLIPSAHLW